MKKEESVHIARKSRGFYLTAYSSTLTECLALSLILTSCCGGPETTGNTAGPVKAITTQADVRSFYVKAAKDIPDYGRFVAEPPPDTFANFTSSISALAKASEGDGLGSAELQFLSQFSKEAVRLGVRSQGIMYLRDAGYRLAEGYMNGAFFGSLPQRDRVETRAAPQTGPQTATQTQVVEAATLEQSIARVVDASTNALRANPNDIQAREDLRMAFRAGEAQGFSGMFLTILDNAKDIVIEELERNPYLSSGADEASVTGEEPLPRLRVDVTQPATASDPRQVTIGFRNQTLVNRDINLELTWFDESNNKDTRIMSLRLDENGEGQTEQVDVPASAKTLVVRAPTSIPLTVAL